jgi:hypothetical protein
MGGVDQHNHLCSSFSLGKVHEFQKYYGKLLLFVMDVALTNAWVYYSLTNPEEAQRDGARADFFVTLGAQLVKQNTDWESKYKTASRRALSDNTSIIDVVIPTATQKWEILWIGNWQRIQTNGLQLNPIPFELMQ